ncbi:MAG: response regulator transcription factor [Egibacteraceae bacterium]
MKVLVVEDDRRVAIPLCSRLRDHGYDIVWVVTGEEALRPHDADLVLLDLRLPDIDGIDVCRKLRRSSDVPIIIVTARDSEQERVRGLRAGADDYVTKPFSVREVIARIDAVMRRVGAAKARQWRTDASKTIELKRLCVDNARREVRVDGTVVTLSRKEFDLLALFAQAQEQKPGTVVRREELLDFVWQGKGSPRTLDTHVNNLRHKLGAAIEIETVRGVGYRLVVE